MRASPFWPTAFFAFSLLVSPAAFALSVDHEGGTNSDGTAKFADPDEQSPAFAHGPSENGPSVNVQQGMAPMVSPGMYGSDNSRSFNPQNQGPDAFDQAYSRK